MFVIQYPWLKIHLKKIVHQYNNKTLHHTILINSPFGMGIKCLMHNICHYFLCKSKLSLNNCSKCTNNFSFNLNYRPDWYTVGSKNNSKQVGIDEIRYVIENIYLTSSQYGPKLIWIMNINNLTESSINCLLKSIEEPPENTFFFIRTSLYHKVPVTLRSRCMLWNIKPPQKEESLKWLRENTGVSIEKCKIALHLCDGIPIFSKNILSSLVWNLRKNFFEILSFSINENNLLLLQSILNQKKINLLVDWIIVLFVDILKYQKKMFYYIQNLDQKKIIENFSKKFSYEDINNSIILWLNCKKKINNHPEISVELLILKTLMQWEKILNMKIYI
ncbi:DNA polymerase III delta' subunit [Buchnera aphidicola (Nipponaphis monzeni)]|uniref:DNA polymerase III subunit delta' n=1 Tax=Buchnera aphidicola (Nipponaphis monzeni) TaxID=2495405 RepID=A0A455TAD1_9GAMM|nr:DNA polymerase III subunit delta' C-terminal domain-containing protein [Buchnera aphidicola]BBI01282.1 DNA polymerase III delta' subunit [Buchnera aphidicola (Nipponaphis monzeni)]